MRSEELRTARRRNAVIAALAIVLAAIMVIPAGYGQYTASLTDQETVGVRSVYVNLSQAGYTNETRMATDEITMLYTDFEYEVVSTDTPADTLVRITIPSEDRDALKTYDIVKFRIFSTIAGTLHTAGFILHVTTTADSQNTREGEVPFSIPGRTVTANTGQIVESRIDAQTGTGQYVFYLKVTDMKSMPTAEAGAALTQYIFVGT